MRRVAPSGPGAPYAFLHRPAELSRVVTIQLGCGEHSAQLLSTSRMQKMWVSGFDLERPGRQLRESNWITQRNDRLVAFVEETVG